MLVWLLFALGLVWIVLGATKTTGLKQFERASEAVATWFFIFGLLHLVLALFLLNAPAAFGQQLNATVNNTYANFTGLEQTDCWNETGDFIGNGTTDKTESLLVGQTTVYSYSVAGQEIVNTIFYFDLATIAVYFILFMLSVFKIAVDETRRRIH